MSNQTALKPLTLLAVALVTLTAIAGIVITSEDLDAKTFGSASSPLTELDTDMDSADGNTYYVEVGSSVYICGIGDAGGLDEFSFDVTGVTSGYGLTFKSGSYDPDGGCGQGLVSGTLTKAGTITVSGESYDRLAGYGDMSCTIIAVSLGPEPESIDIGWALSSSRGTCHPGTTCTMIVEVLPTDVSNGDVTWEFNNGNARVTDYNVTDDAYGYRYWLTIEGVNIGTSVITVSSVADPSVSETYTIQIQGWTCFLNYHPNGGLNPDGDPDEWWDSEVVDERYGTAEIPVTYEEPTRDGYTFLGWSYNPSATSPDSRYDPGDIVEVTYDDDFYLYAVWKSNTVYTSSVSISSSGGNQINIGDSLTLTATTSPLNASNRGATFSVQSGSQYVSLSGSSITSTGGKVTVTGTAAGTAVIKATSSDGRSSSTFSITVIQPTYNFNLIYASGCSDAVQNMPTNPGQATTSETTHSFTISSLTPTRNGYTFTGWLGSDGQTYQPGGSVSVGRNQTVTLTAQWVQNTYTCYINYNSTVTGHSNFPTNGQFTGTSTADHTFTISALTPTHPDYIFLGWATSNGGPVEKQPGQTIDCPYNGSVNLWAVWDAKQITITSEQSSVGMICGDPFSYTVETDKEGVVVSVSGASWLSVSGSTISGTAPNQPGTYDITVQVVKDGGYTTATQSFQIVVYSNIGFISEPSADGIYTYMMD